MNLAKVYFEVKRIVDRVDFSLLYRGFKPMKFALYNESECFFDGDYVEKTDQFIANTSIEYKGEMIAIWNMDKEFDLDILASKIIHEMFHAFQMMNDEKRFPNEMEALIQYRYSVENLSIKLIENKLITELLTCFDEQKFSQLLQLRKRRLKHFPYEAMYEALIEQLEGSADYVERNALKQISLIKYEQNLNESIKKLNSPEKFFPIRIISYSIGGLFFDVLKKAGIDFEGFEERPTSLSVLDDVEEANEVEDNQKLKKLIENYHRITEDIVKQAILKQDCIFDGIAELTGVNVYDARYFKPYVVSSYFVSLNYEEERIVEYGDFVIEINAEGKAVKVYRQ